jgi:hypothetical protein
LRSSAIRSRPLVGQYQIEQDELHLGLVIEQPHGVSAIRGLHDNGLGVKLPQDGTQRFADEAVIFDDQKVHARTGSLRQNQPEPEHAFLPSPRLFA